MLELVTIAEICTTISMMARAMATLVGQDTLAPHVPSLALRVRDFTQINPSHFHGSKVEEDA